MSDFDARMRNIEMQLVEYREAIAAADAWYRDWRRRQGMNGFRCARPQPSPLAPAFPVKQSEAAE